VSELVYIQSTTVEQQLGGITDFARACAIRGLAASLPVEVLCCQWYMHDAGNMSRPQGQVVPAIDERIRQTPAAYACCSLLQGLHEGSLASIETSSDLHIKYNSFAALAATLARQAAILRHAGEQCEDVKDRSSEVRPTQHVCRLLSHRDIRHPAEAA
jgi:hypothetical protein